ncbi:MAG: sugar phosphate isomerase/epimerase [Lentisphaeria bacterium]
MEKKQIAAQLYTLREFTQNPADIAGTFAKVRKIGYEAVQISALGPIDDKELVKIAQNEGINICASHDNGKLICEETDKVIEHLLNINCKYTAYPYPHYYPKTANGVIEFARAINKAAIKMKEAGITLCYHNHAIEFQKFDGEFMLDIILREAPQVQGELDTHWVQAGGQDPTKWIEKLSSRQPLLHLKDYAVVGNDRRLAAVGSGNLDWNSIILAGEKAGVQYFIVEQDDCYGVNPFDELKSSYDYLTENFVK